MNLLTFSANTTNCFPMANTTTGGQLVTEFNLRSRESVATDANVQYMIGPSYVHSESDFKVTLQEGSDTILEIAPGRGVINGHYVENLAPMIIDLNSVAARAKELGEDPIRGMLCVGIRIMYSTLPTMAGTIVTENNEDMFEGIQLVILPNHKFKLPSDVPTDENAVTAHIKLADVLYDYNQVSIITNYLDKCKSIDADRIGNIDGVLSNNYISKRGLEPGNHYVLSTKGNGGNNTDDWCNANDSLMVWDKSPERTTDAPLRNSEAAFKRNLDDSISLVIPHKQVDGGRVNVSGAVEYLADKVLPLPLADYDKCTPGTVNSKYTAKIKNEVQRVLDLQFSKGKQRGYIKQLSTNVIFSDENAGQSELPPIGSNWSAGDYILVGQDLTLDNISDGVQAPATMYVVVPGRVKFVVYTDNKPDGTLLGHFEGSTDPEIELIVHNDTYFQLLSREPSDWATNYVKYYRLVETDSGVTQLVKLTDDPGEFLENTFYATVSVPGLVSANNESTLFNNIDLSQYRGEVNHDYFEYVKTDLDTQRVTTYYFIVSESGNREYSDPIWLTGQIPYAQESVVGGFLNVPETATDYGYIYRDDSGHLRLVDYELLRSGVLAYQLGEDYTAPSGITTEEIQNYLDEYVNERVAFPNYNQVANSPNPNIINITITLPKEDNPTTLTIHDIDSRFNTSIYLHINGEVDSNTTILISNCEKLRIDSNINNSITSDSKPTIALYCCNLYYDADILNMIKSENIYNMSLWYERFNDSDPNLFIDGMTVRELDSAIITEDLDFWNKTVSNDNHLLYGLKSLTFRQDGMIIGCELLIKNNTTAINQLGSKVVVSNFDLPQGLGLIYPKTKLSKQLKVTGSFISAYPIDSATKFMVINTHFTALSQCYSEYDSNANISGVISFLIDTLEVDNITGIDNTVGKSIDGWNPDSFHLFSGGVIN